jgi:hypothetical protein
LLGVVVGSELVLWPFFAEILRGVVLAVVAQTLAPIKLSS